MKKHTLLVLGLLFLVRGLSAQTPDSTIQELAQQKIRVFGLLMEQLASPGLDLGTRASIERRLELHFLDNREVYFHQDLNNSLGNPPPLSSSAYFTQLKVLYPNGASLKTYFLEHSPVYYSKSREMHYMIFRVKRSFKGLNAMAKKEVAIEKNLDYVVKLMEGGNLGIEIMNGFEADGDHPGPKGLDGLSGKEGNPPLVFSGSLVPEENKLEEARQALEINKEKILRFEAMEEVKAEREESPAERKIRKKQVKAEKARLQRELDKAKAERRSLTTNRLNIRIGYGYFVSDTTVNQLPSRIGKTRLESWVAKLDFQYKVAGLQRNPNGKWQKAHTLGLFMNYGKQAASNVVHLLKKEEVGQWRPDTTTSARTFFEAEMGWMLREELRISGGMGMMQVPSLSDGVSRIKNQSYYCFTAGISPRFYDILELDFNLTGQLINGTLRPRANVNAVILIKARRR